MRKRRIQRENRFFYLALWICAAIFAFFVSFAHTFVLSYAAISGSGTYSSPYTGKAAKGDQFTHDSYVKNLSSTNGAKIKLESIYKANQYELLFSSGIGLFPDGSTEKRQTVTYGQTIQLPDAPTADGYTFAGWYLKGNGEGGIPTGADASRANCLLDDDSIYSIANDDSGDMALSEQAEDGVTKAAALWRTSSYNPQDGNEAESPADGVPEYTLDPWGDKNAANSCIEWLKNAPDRGSYIAAHGSTAFQYGRMAFSAETGLATGYEWYLKKTSASDYSKLSETGAVLTLTEVDRSYNDAELKCKVSIGGEGEKLELSTGLTVYWLPEIIDTAVYVDGEAI